MIYNYYGVSMIKKDYLEKAVSYVIFILLVGLPAVKLTAYFLYLSRKINDVYEFNHVYVLWVVLPLLVLIYLIGIFTKKYKFTYVDGIMSTLIILAILSTVFAINTKIAIYGEIYRNEGLLSILSYYFIFLNVKNISNVKYKQTIINVLLGAAVFQVIYGGLQVFTNFPFIKHYSKNYMAMALVGNPNFFGSYIVMPLMYSIYSFLTNKKIRYFILSIIYFIGLCLANSTGPFLSFIVAFIFLIIVFRKKISIKHLIISIIVLCITFFTTDYFIRYTNTKFNYSGINRSYNIKDEVFDTVTNPSKEGLANSRLIVWKKSLPLIKKYWLIGAGLDNFAKAYPQEGYVIFDKAHNIYIQMAVTNGIFALILYCTLCLIAFIKGFKFRSNFYIGLYMAFVVYSIQAFGNINVVDVTPCFYIILAMLFSKIYEPIKDKN